MPSWTPPHPQSAVEKFVRAIRTPHKLLTLHPRTIGHPSNAAALSPAIVLSAVSAFEGFAEEFTAIMLARKGAGFAEIAKAVGGWNNPVLPEFAQRMKKDHPGAAAAIDAPSTITVLEFKTVRATAPVNRVLPWDQVLVHSRAWRQVRHSLSHGLTTGWRAERWPPPLRQDDPPASEVLRPRSNDERSLGVYGAISCARVFTLGARKIADAVADDCSLLLDWYELPQFD